MLTLLIPAPPIFLKQDGLILTASPRFSSNPDLRADSSTEQELATELSHTKIRRIAIKNSGCSALFLEPGQRTIPKNLSVNLLTKHTRFESSKPQNAVFV